jgi:outer membrane receptor protein involved in Fe transport
MNCNISASLGVFGLRSSALRRLFMAMALTVAMITTLFGGALHAQTIYGSVNGVVKDPSGAVMTMVSVTVRETSTGSEYKTVTNNSGSYRISFLKPGGYTVSFEKAGFAKFITAELSLVLNQDLVVDASLQLSAESQIITVTEEATSLNTTNPQVGGELTGADLVNLPESTGTHGANEFLITKTFAGAGSTSQDYSNVNNLTLGGGRPDTNPLIIDGLPSNMGVDGTYGLVPTPDSTEELQVLTAPFSAQYGQSGGGAVITTTKSGTANFHGSAFEYYNDQSLNAFSYFTAPGTPKPGAVFNYFGGSIGGPVLLPKIFNGRLRHLFFFTDWEDTLTHAAATTNTNVPTLAERGGDFSGLTPQGTVNPIIYDPQQTSVVNGKVTRKPFPGNIIPKSRLDQVAQNILNFLPAPNCSFDTFNYCVNPTSLSSYLYNADRIDFNASDYDHIWAKFSRDGPTNQPVDYINSAANPSDLNGWVDNHSEISWSHIFSPRISNEARIGYVSEANFATPSTTNVGSIGLQGVILDQFPNITTTGINSGSKLGTGSLSRTRDGHIIINDALVLEMGHHSLSVGGEFIKYAYSVLDPGVLSGSYTFNGTFTAIPGSDVTGLADLVLGLPATTSISTTNTVFHENLAYFAGYVQDDYRITPRLTLNLGLRWEFDGPYSEAHNQMYTFNPNVTDTTTNLPGGIQFAGVNGAPHTLIARVYTGFLPRAGFNYRLFRNTVLRGGYGIYELPSIGFGTTALSSTSTVSATFQSSDGGVTPPYQLSQGVPAYHPNVGPNGLPLIPTSLTNPTSNVTELEQRSILPYIQEWQLGVEQDFGKGWILDVDYEGNHGVHQPVSLQINQIAPSPGCCFGVKNAQSLRPFPQFLNVTYNTNAGASEYDALLAQFTHRWSNGISLRGAYTWAHGLDDVDASARADAAPVQNVFNLHSQWGTAMTNIPQRFSLSAVYELPFGAGGRFRTNSSVLNQVLAHWRVSAVAQFQKGYPYFITQNNTLGLFSGGQYVTKVGNPNLSRSKRTVQQWFNTAAFQITPQDVLGNAPRAAFYGPGQNVWEMSVMRDVHFTEHTSFTFRIDGHNVFNHPQFSGLNTTITAPAFGSVTGAQDARTVLFSGRYNF